MTRNDPLWALVLGYSFFLAGHVFDIVAVVPVWTTRYFVPINNYIGQDRYDPTTLKALVDGCWETARAGLVGLELVSAIALLERWPHGPRPST